jgi:hypothetical protein
LSSEIGFVAFSRSVLKGRGFSHAATKERMLRDFDGQACLRQKKRRLDARAAYSTIFPDYQVGRGKPAIFQTLYLPCNEDVERNRRQKGA